MIRRVIPHLCIISALMTLTLVILDHFNPGMNFIGNGFFKILLIVFCLLSLIAAGFLIAHERRQK